MKPSQFAFLLILCVVGWFLACYILYHLTVLT